ncbi:hypothetical protein [Undibacterium sp. TC9W]|uniref:hypothetical protein n=1 Tax=Undibacterium sp. TC9W TaxID=3413053 RepID=UPI003BF4D99E
MKSRSACHVRADHGGVANTRDSPAIAVFCALPWFAGHMSFTSAFTMTVHWTTKTS